MTWTSDNHELFTDLTEALAMACSVVCAAVIVKDGDSPGHLIGDPEAGQLLMTLDSVQATLADGIPRTEVPPPGTVLAAAAFIAVEPLSIPHQQSLATVIAFAGKHLNDCERAVALLHSLATETANELMFLRQTPFLAAAFGEIECGVTIADPSLEDTPLVYANAAFERMTGYSRAELLGRNCRFLQGDLRDQPGLRIIRNALARGTDCTVELSNVRRNGEPFQNRLKLRAIRTHDGTLSHIIGIQLDISKEYSALESLGRQKCRYESLIETQSGYTWLMNARGELIDVPEKWLELAGLSSLSGTPDLAAIRSALTPEAAEAFREGWDEALRNMTPFEVIYQLPPESNSPRWFLDRIMPVLDDENQLIEWIAASQEVTKLKRVEKELERAAYEDRLTGILSPEGFAHRLDERLKGNDLHPASPVIVVDIKALREINNTQGIGEWVLRQACRDLKAWQDAGLTVCPVSINLSLIQFQLGSVPDRVREALTEYNIAPGELTLEITESVFEQHGHALKKDLEALSAMGVRLSLDDFGIGYSSLGHLKDYFFDEIKIDKSFVCQLDDGLYAQAIVKAIIFIAAAIDADVVAEGIELTKDIETLQHLGCDKGQGFHYSHALPEPSWRQLLISKKAFA